MRLAENKIMEIREALKKQNFSKIIIEAKILKEWSNKMVSYFPVGSEASEDNYSAASADIWNNLKHFKKLVRDKRDGINQIISSAKEKNESHVTDAIWDTLDTCNTCHEQFRN